MPIGGAYAHMFEDLLQVISYNNYDMKGQTYRYFTNDPLYPFGYGLSNSTFTYSNLVLSNTTIEPGQLVDVSVQVKNNGLFDAEEVSLTFKHKLQPNF